MDKKNGILLTGIIGLYFLWGGSSYISEMYRLYEYFSPRTVDLIALSLNYFCQALGIIYFSYSYRKNPQLILKKTTYYGSLIVSAISILSMLTIGNPYLIIFFGGIMNLLLGFLAAFQLSLLATHVSKNNRGKIFGLAYAMGSLGTYILSILGKGNMIKSPYASLIYLGLIGLTYILMARMNFYTIDKKEIGKVTIDRRFFTQVFFVFLLMALINSIGGNYQSETIFKEKVNFELARAFYGIGLIGAGLISDKNRKFGAFLALGSLFFPFISLAIYREGEFIFLIWALSYLLLGLYSVYRAIFFVDMVGEREEWFYLAGLGLCIGRIGEGIGGLVNPFIMSDYLLASLYIVGLFIPLILVFISLYGVTYTEKIIEAKNTMSFEDFVLGHSLTSREREVLGYILDGLSNIEIGGKAFISENTVKFHIKNLLKKTGCSNRQEILELFNRLGIEKEYGSEVIK